jgi:POT family proton-dependent oligopeptide transporter
MGAILSDWLWGKYKTIMILSVVYCLGHLALALDETRMGLAIGLSLIAIGSGGIKPCVSAHVGDQFGPQNKHLLSRVFSWFYFSINLGSFLSTLLTPLLLDKYGPSVAFGLPGGLMILATFVFWLGRNSFIHIPAGGAQFIKQSFSGEGLRALLKLSTIYIFIAVFWALFDQTGSAWVLQAEKMNRNLFGFELYSSQIQAINPLLILLFIPIFTYGLYPLINRVFPLTPLRKIGLGLFVAAIAFAITAHAEGLISMGQRPTIAWQILAYAIITAAEVLVSITALEFSYTQAPHAMKSIVMALFFFSVSLGNAFTAVVNYFILNPDQTSKLAGAEYFWFFTFVMLAAAILYILVAKGYKEKTYIHGEPALDEPIDAEQGQP